MEQLDACRIYEDYYSKKKKVILEILKEYKNRGWKIALWGAGKRGQGFLNAFDQNCKYIDYIYDKDEKKYGQVLDLGHRIADYHQEKAEVVLVANNLFELEVLHAVKDVNPMTTVINLDAIVLGDLQAEEILQEKKLDLSKARECKICAVVALYSPDFEVVENIRTYATELDQVYLYDNSEKKDDEVVAKLKELPNSIYIDGHGNQGLSVAFNKVAEIAENEGHDWMITFDQDSRAEQGMIATMREYADSFSCDDSVAILAPTVNEIDAKKDTPEIYRTFCDKVIQSGAMNRLSILKKVGGYDEKIFIDEVDNEYCIRCFIQGYKIIRINPAVLMHNQQDGHVQKFLKEGTMLFINKFTPMRYYYRYRNELYCYNKYKESYPLYALDCLNMIRKLELQVPYESDKDRIIKAIQQAKYDNEHGIMGKVQLKE